MGTYTNRVSRRGGQPLIVGGKKVYKGREILRDPGLSELVDQWLRAEGAPYFSKIGGFEVFVLKRSWDSRQELNITRTADEMSCQLIGNSVYETHSKHQIAGVYLSGVKLTGRASGHEVLIGCIGVYTSDIVARFEEFEMLRASSTSEISDNDISDIESAFSSWRIQCLYDDRDFAFDIVQESFGAVLPVKQIRLSLNEAGENISQYVTVALPFALLWTPYFKKLAEKAAEDTYVKIKEGVWAGVLALANRCAALERPELTISTVYKACEIHLIFRKPALKTISSDMFASLRDSVGEAVSTVDGLLRLGKAPREIVYAYHVRKRRWECRHIQDWDKSLIAAEVITSIAAIQDRDTSVGVVRDLDEDATMK